MIIAQSNTIPAIRLAATAIRHHQHQHQHRLRFLQNRFVLPTAPTAASFHRLTLGAKSARAFSTNEETSADVQKLPRKPSLCTADELHYVPVKKSDWRLAVWRYIPPPQQAPARNHPLLLLSGVGTNAIAYDLSPGSSFARYMCGQGFDTWVLEVRGAGLSMQGLDCKVVEESAHTKSEQMEAAAEKMTEGAWPANQQQSTFSSNSNNPEIAAVNDEPTGIATARDGSKLVSEFSETFTRLSERLSGFLSESQSKIMSAKFFDQISNLFEDSFLLGRFSEIKEKVLNLLDTKQNFGVSGQIKELSQKLVDIIDDGQRSVTPQLFDLQERLLMTIDDFQKQLDFIVKYDWDFDNYLEEDIPAVMEYIRAQSKPKDGRLLAIGHSMGGILLYAMVSRYSSEGRDPGLAAIGTLASSLDYTTSKSTLKLLLPLADPAQFLNVPVIPLGAMLSAAYPLSSHPPYVLSWMNDLISAQDMMQPELLKKLILNSFCTIPAKLLLQLTSAFREGGLQDRSGTFFYKDHIHKSSVPILALAGDRDLICPPEAVYETVRLIPEHLVMYKVFGEPNGTHYAHYDLVGGRMAVEQIYPCIIQFLSRHDSDQ
ncbi:Uncharacterised conserved protein UCP031088-alpha/beta hydrolase [Striga hermonthica]|uniref:Uncharacterized conserved protein UCP031088-alpha/beta hydrolase n=1 Tax=Striga hermonthica TaxID=68872 RepID=A0A9N7NLK8_STRHE|nr:Uncharacterised conserved protein UCP031088-alpha/beta hydrolase [Striga hermonthica]